MIGSSICYYLYQTIHYDPDVEESYRDTARDNWEMLECSLHDVCEYMTLWAEVTRVSTYLGPGFEVTVDCFDEGESADEAMTTVRLEGRPPM